MFSELCKPWRLLFCGVSPMRSKSNPAEEVEFRKRSAFGHH